MRSCKKTLGLGWSSFSTSLGDMIDHQLNILRNTMKWSKTLRTNISKKHVMNDTMLHHFTHLEEEEYNVSVTLR